MQPAAPPELKAVTFAYIEEPPFAVEAEDGAIGSDVELARQVLALMGIDEVETRKVEFADLMPGVAAGRWTMNTGLFITPERAREVAFSDPIWALTDGLIVRADNPRAIASYGSMAADPHARLGVVRGTVQAEDARREGLPRDRIVEFGAQDEALAAVRTGRVAAYSATALGQRTVLARLSDSDLQLAADFSPPMRGGRPGANFGAFSFARSNLAFVERFNAAMATYFGGPEYRNMAARYGLTAAEIDPALAMRGRVEDLLAAGA